MGRGSAGVEMYDGRQFLTVTGMRLPARPAALADHAATLWNLQRTFAPARPPAVRSPASGAGFRGSDAALLSRAFAAANAAATRRLWDGDHARYASASEALLGLAQRLAFWSGPDADRLFDLMTGSPLVAATEAARAKWQSPRPGGPWGLAYVAVQAVATCRRYHPGSVSPDPDPSRGPTPQPPPCKTVSSSLIAPNDEVTLGGPTLVAAVAWARAGNAAPGRGPADVLAAVCYRLSVTSAGGAFYLSARTAGELTGVSHAAAAVRIKAMVAGGTLAVVRPGDRRPAGGAASVYQWVGGSEAPCSEVK